MKSIIQVEDYYHLLVQAKELYERVHIEESSPLQEHRCRLSNIPTEALCTVVYELLTHVKAEYLHTLFHKDLTMIGKRT